tara:strand:- start:45 stop:899 length:855 start_codon:yes stop_codon:yes gene_type:complete
MALQVFLVARNNLNYEFETFNNISINKRTPVSPMPLPEEDSDENVLIKVEGNTTTMSISWTILNATSPVGTGDIIWDASLGRWRSNTMESSFSSFKQVEYLETSFTPNSINDYFQVKIFDTEQTDKTNNNAAYTKDGLLQGFTFNTDSSSPVNWTGNMEFIEGAVVTTLSGNTHEAATIVTQSFTGGGTRTGISVTFKEFENYSANDRPVTIGAILRWKPQAGVNMWKEKEVTFTAVSGNPPQYTQTFLIPDINATGNSLIRISLTTVSGRGEWTKTEDSHVVV